DEKAGTSTNTGISAQQKHSPKSAPVSSVDESGNSATVCSSSMAPPPPPPGPAPIIAHLRSPRSECSLSSWGQSAGSEHDSYSSPITPGVESADEKKERFRKSLSHLATIDPAVLLAEMKETQKSKSSESSTDLRSSLMREICEAGGAKSFKKKSKSTSQQYPT
uniref:WH2 domain-containing protein n=1 Tax=Parascaris univalens TaxID=6257 RepID=A0A915BKX1_PARUN